MITHDLVIKMLDFVKDPSCGTFEYGKWGILNMEQRQLIRRLCESWLILDEATNKQMLEIERLNNKVEELMELYTTERHCKDDYKAIIKEVREWANKTIFYFDFEEEITKHAFDLLYTKQGQELLEILGRENEL